MQDTQCDYLVRMDFTKKKKIRVRTFHVFPLNATKGNLYKKLSAFCLSIYVYVVVACSFR